MIKSKIQNSKISTPFVTSWTPKMTQNGPKSPKPQENSIKWLFGSKNEHRQFFCFGEGKPMIKSNIQNYKILIPFVTSWTPKRPKTVQKLSSDNRQISQLNDCVGLRMRIGEFLWMDSRFWCQNFDILTFWRGKMTFWRQIWRQVS